MTRIVLISSLFLVFGLPLHTAEAKKYIEIEASYEVSAADIRIPRRGLGVVRVETCEDCKKLRFNLTPASRAFVNDQPVTIQQFRNLAMANDAPAYIFYEPGSYAITRLILDIPGFN